MSDDLEHARGAFAAWARAQRGLEVEDIVRRPELDGGGFFGFTAVGPGRPVRGLAGHDRVLSYRDPDAFAAWLAAVDFAHAQDADPVQLVHVYRSLQPPTDSRYAEDSFPLLYKQQLATAPAGDAAALPRLEADGDGRRVDVWFQCEPGSRLERWSFRVGPDNGFRIERGVVSA